MITQEVMAVLTENELECLGTHISPQTLRESLTQEQQTLVLFQMLEAKGGLLHLSDLGLSVWQASFRKRNLDPVWRVQLCAKR